MAIVCVRKSGAVLRAENRLRGAPNPEREESEWRKKGVGVPEEDQDAEDLRRFYEEALLRYTQGLQVDGRVPGSLRAGLNSALTSYRNSMPAALAAAVQLACAQGENPQEAWNQLVPSIQSQAGRLSGIVAHYDHSFQSYLALREQGEYRRFLFVGEGGESSCARCTAQHGRVLSLEELAGEGLIPPLHPNCKCRLVAMDTQAEQVYNRDRGWFLDRLESGLENRDETVLLMRQEYLTFGSTPLTLVEPEPPGTTAIDGTEEEAERARQLVIWAQEFNRDVGLFWDAFSAAFDERQERVEIALERESLRMLLPAVLDHITFGIVSGFAEGIAENYRTYLDDPSLYNLLNLVTLGTVEMADGALFPEKPLSFQHLLDLTGVGALAFVALRGVRAARSARAARGTGAGAARTADDLADDAARQGGQAGAGGAGRGTLTGSLDKLSQSERTMVDDLLNQGRNVEIVPRSTVQGVQTPDFKINGASTELKTLTGTSLNTPVTRIQEAFKQGKNVLLDARGNPNITATEVETIFRRIEGIYKDGIPGEIEIWTNDGIYRR